MHHDQRQEHKAARRNGKPKASDPQVRAQNITAKLDQRVKRGCGSPYRKMRMQGIKSKLLGGTGKC